LATSTLIGTCNRSPKRDLFRAVSMDCSRSRLVSPRRISADGARIGNAVGDVRELVFFRLFFSLRRCLFGECNPPLLCFSAIPFGGCVHPLLDEHLNCNCRIMFYCTLSNSRGCSHFSVPRSRNDAVAGDWQTNIGHKPFTQRAEFLPSGRVSTRRRAPKISLGCERNHKSCSMARTFSRCCQYRTQREREGENV